MTLSLLNDDFVTVQFTDDSCVGSTLPEILEALVDDDVVSFRALQPHQQQPWYSLLTQLGAMAVTRENDGQTPTNATEWRELLVALSDGNEAAWHLVVDDVSEPAFLQSPLPEGSLDEAGYSQDVDTPDDLDILITSKNHDVKQHRISRPDPEHWLFSLVTLQTLEGFLGRGNYGIVRMNGGFGNRPMVGLTPGLSWGARFKRDLDVLLDERDELLDRYDADGEALIWIEPWDGKKDSAIPLRECDPYFIEICRRIRLETGDSETLRCWRNNTKGQRVDAPDSLNGDTGDPWTPIEKKGAKALTVGGSGFTYELLQELLLGDEYRKPAALEFRENERDGAYLTARTLVRGQGKTDGLHHRVIYVPSNISNKLFGEPSLRKKLAERARERVSLVAKVQKQILYPAIATLLSSGRDEQVDWDQVRPWTDAFDEAVDERFFEQLWASVDMSQQEARAAWQSILFDEAEKQYENAEDSAPIADIHRYRAISEARGVFFGKAKDVLESANIFNTDDTQQIEETEHVETTPG